MRRPAPALDATPHASTLARRYARISRALAGRTPFLTANIGTQIQEPGAGGPPGPVKPNSSANVAQNGGQGGEPPSLLDTRGNCCASDGTEKEIPNCSNSGRASSHLPTTEKRHSKRDRRGRGVRRSWRGWAGRVADELVKLGHDRLASNLRDCSSGAWCRACEDCKEPYASVVVQSSCDLRICPFCSRSRARQTVEVMARALERVPDYVAARAPELVAKLEALAHDRAAVAARHRASAERARRDVTNPRRMRARIERAERLARAAEEQAERARFDAARAREATRGGWSWKLVTITGPWDPSDPHAYTVEGLRDRVAIAWERWERVRERYSAGGLLASVAKVECSEIGHVHTHALVYGPYMVREHVIEIAGALVDLRSITDGYATADTMHEPAKAGAQLRQAKRERARNRMSFRTPSAKEVLRAGLREACKYIAKVPSVLRNDWVAGRSAKVIHPALAAAWVIALRGAKAGRIYGPARDAYTCEQLQRDPSMAPPQREEHCRACGSLSLAEPRLEWTSTVARNLGLGWGAIVKICRRPVKRAV